MKQLIKAQLALAVVIGLAGAQAQAGETPISAVQDWSSRSVIQNKTMFPDEFAKAGKTADMQKLYSDPRYLAAVLRRVESELPRSAQQLQRSPAASKTAAATCTDRRRGHCPSTETDSSNPESIARDWSNVLGGGTDGQGGRGAMGVFPAKYNFDIFAAPSCSNDFVVYTTNAAGATSSGTQKQWVGTLNIAAFVNLLGAAEGTVTIGSSSPRQVVLTATNGANTGTNFQTSDGLLQSLSSDQKAINLRDAINRATAQTGFQATVSGSVLTVTSNTTTAVATGLVTENELDFAFAASGGTGTAGQPTIIAFNQMYQGTCNGSWNQNGATKAPNVMWSYNTGTGYTTETSPVLSYLDNGKQVAFVQRSGNVLQLVLLKGQSGQGSAASPAALTPSATAAAYRACISNCSYTITFSTAVGANNLNSLPTYSSPFVDYVGDILWVGDGNGILHKFSGVFVGSPQEVTTGGFPKAVELGLKLSSPVFDYNNSVYVGSESGTGTTGGKIYRINAGSGVTAASSSKLALASTTGVRESPIIDLRSQSVYAFIFNDNTTSYTDTTRCQAYNNEIDGCRAIFRFATNFASNTSGTRQWIGRGNGTTRTLYAGGFDDAFYNSANGTGNMYITGGRADNTFYATIWKMPITAGALGSPVAGPEIGVRDRYTDGDAGTGLNGSNDNLQNLSPTTVILNPNTGFEYLYASTASWGIATGCGNGTYAGGACLYMYALNQSVTTGTNAGETWTLRISSSQIGTGTLNLEGNVLTAGTTFSTAGNRSADRTALVNAINNITGYSAVTSGNCNNNNGNCDLIITRAAFGNVAASTVTNALTNVTQTANANGSVAVTSIQPITWATTITPAAALPVTAGNGAVPASQVPGGTGGIVVDNVRPTSEPGTSQIYFTQGGTTGNAIQASQSGLQ